MRTMEVTDINRPIIRQSGSMITNMGAESGHCHMPGMALESLVCYKHSTMNIAKTVPLRTLLKAIHIKKYDSPVSAQTIITGIAYDSRMVKEGNIFVAIQGGNSDGHTYIPSALEQGASIVVGSRDPEDVNRSGDQAFPYIQVDEPRVALAHLAAAYYGYPARRMTVIGVTGTDGKTTTTNLVHNILLEAGIICGMISSVNAVIGRGEVMDTGFHVTTPEATEVQRYLSMMADSGCTHAVLETTSHGLAQHRVTGCEYDIAVVTNITHEHLDYHQTYEDYRAAKGKLFTNLIDTCIKPQGNPRISVLNRDDISYDFLHHLIRTEQVSYSIEPGLTDVWAEDIKQSADGVHFTAVVNSPRAGRIQFEIRSTLTGLYNVSNCLAAIAATVRGLGIPAVAAQRGITNLAGVAGRMERIDMGQDFAAIVDFAHTPNALRRVLETVRQMTDRRIITVFGSAGLRDRQKRRLMAEISIKLADVTILTAEDPRTESLDSILAEMADAAGKSGGVEGETFWRVPDRSEAIRKAVRTATKGDLVIACGKGHEQSMCFGIIEYPWDDRVAMRAALAELLMIPGPQIPYLPTSGKYPE